MNSPYKLVVFDWEGTVADTLGMILHTVAAQARILGFGEIDPYNTREYINLGLVQSLKKVFPHLSLHQQEQLVQAVHHAMLSKNTEVCLIPGAFEFIQRLQLAKIDIAVATNKGHQSLQRALHATGLDQYFKITRSAGQVPAKPCPQMLEEIMAEFGCDASSTLMIGDSVSDMEMASSIHVTAIGVDFYHQQERALLEAGALVVFDDYRSLATFLNVPKI